MQKILAYPLTFIYFLCFLLTLVVFHPIQWLCFNLFGYKAHKISVDWLQFFIMRCLNILGTRFTFNKPHNIPKNQPITIARRSSPKAKDLSQSEISLNLTL